MGRPQRNDVDYFPFLCKEGKAMFYIEHKYGNDGYATWVKLLRQLAVTNYHYLHFESKADIMFLAAKCKVSEETLESILNDLAELGEINTDLWKKSRVVYSEKFIENIEAAYERRNNKPLHLDSLCSHLMSLGILKKSKSKLKEGINPHSILDNSIEDYNREEKIREEKEFLFNQFWDLYDKKVGDKKKCQSKWMKLKEEEMEKIFKTLPEYIKATPDKKFRKNVETYLNNKSWNDEIILPTKNNDNSDGIYDFDFA